MGLDMYACKTLEDDYSTVDFSIENAEVIQSWRKHPNLHGWMEMLYRERKVGWGHTSIATTFAHTR